MSTLARTARVAPSVRPAEAEARSSTLASLSLPLDPWLVLALVGLAVCSLLALGSTGQGAAGSASYYVQRQSIYLGIGFAAMLVISRLDYALLRSYARPIYALLLLSLLFVFALGSSANGSVRAIQFPLFSFQASEIGKVLLIVSLSGLFVERFRQIREPRTTALLMLIALIATMFVIIQPDIGSSMVYVVIALAILFVGGTPGRHLAAILALGVLAVTVVLFAAPAAGVHVLKQYQEERLTAFLHPNQNAHKQGWQQEQSKIAIGSGEKTGAKTPTQSALNFLPEAQTDFIFASLGERYGFVGAAVVLSLFALLIWRLLRILTIAKDLFGATVTGGVLAMIMFQVFINVGMTVGISPITGITLPLVSYGGSSIMTTMLGLGLVQSVYARARSTNARKGRATPATAS
ncbi:MAG TPA: FtsW/RodA/SpoVE family cell cycle protein [Solirubrobacteraceae bacterium]|nr:FtsW/RodA/SpoVE family cell cycle protein [Solirubrobacteraceae bacterium]